MPVLGLCNAQNQNCSSPTYKQRRGCRFPPRASRTEGCLGGAPWHSVVRGHEGEDMITGEVCVEGPLCSSRDVVVESELLCKRVEFPLQTHRVLMKRLRPGHEALAFSAP